MSLGDDAVTIQRASLTTDATFGRQYRDWTSPATVTITDVSVQPFAEAENAVDREYTATRMRLYAPSTTDIRAADRVVWRGATYEVDGEPQRWYDGGQLDYVLAVIKRMAG